MRRFLGWVVLGGVLGMPTSARAESPGGKFGLGLGGGLGVVGLSGKYYLGSTAVQGVVGYSGTGRGLGIGADYLLEQPEFLSKPAFAMGWNYGGGATVGVGENFSLGVSGVLGLEFLLRRVPLDIVIEYRPGITLSPDVAVRLFGTNAHVRYYF